MQRSGMYCNGTEMQCNATLRKTTVKCMLMLGK